MCYFEIWEHYFILPPIEGGRGIDCVYKNMILESLIFRRFLYHFSKYIVLRNYLRFTHVAYFDTYVAYLFTCFSYLFTYCLKRQSFPRSEIQRSVRKSTDPSGVSRRVVSLVCPLLLSSPGTPKTTILWGGGLTHP